jgi:hypothetical protein
MKPLIQASVFLIGAWSADLCAQMGHAGDNPIEIPQPGTHTLRILSPTLLELVRINTKAPSPARV